MTCRESFIGLILDSLKRTFFQEGLDFSPVVLTVLILLFKISRNFSKFQTQNLARQVVYSTTQVSDRIMTVIR
jgi:hypothetical protein